MTICFIACSKSKRGYSCLAKDMYLGSLFKKSLEYAISTYDKVYILSAKHGILPLDAKIAPYDKTLSKMSKKQVCEWYGLVEKQMIILGIQDMDFVFLTGELYHKAFEGQKPMAGLSLGNRLKWLNMKLKSKTLFD